MTFQLDTTGRVEFSPWFVSNSGAHLAELIWEDLDPFTQGYIVAMFDFIARGSFVAGWPRTGFSDLAPETLARIIEDCTTFEPEPTVIVNHQYGRNFWRVRQEGRLPKFPALVVVLGSDGRVRFA